MSVRPGDSVIAITADGKRLERVAVSETVDGGDFPVVWVCSPGDWERSLLTGDRPDAWPWPEEDVHPVGGDR